MDYIWHTYNPENTPAPVAGVVSKIGKALHIDPEFCSVKILYDNAYNLVSYKIEQQSEVGDFILTPYLLGEDIKINSISHIFNITTIIFNYHE